MLKEVIASLLCFSSVAKAEHLNTATILAKTVEALPSCIHYKVEGMCYWAKPGLIPKITTTLKVRHFIPDTVVSVYTREAGIPWVEMRVLERAAIANTNAISKKMLGVTFETGVLQSGVGEMGHIHTFEANVTGHPLGVKFFDIFPDMVLHQSKTSAFKPYYSSIIDSLSWRNPESDILGWIQVLNPDYQISTSNGEHWGTVMPRAGMVQHLDAAKAASVTALRALNIATSSAWSHIHQNIENESCGQKCQSSGEAKNTNSTRWQMIYPKTESQCNVLTDSRSKVLALDNQQAQAITWVVWREYKGCIETQGHYIGSINFA